GDKDVPSAGLTSTKPAKGKNNTYQATISQLFQKKATKDTKNANLNKQQPIPTPPPITTIVTSSTTSSLQSPFLLIPSKSSSQLKGEHINKYKGKKAMSSKDAEEKGGDHFHLTEEQIKEQKRIKESAKDEATKHEVKRAKSRIINYDVLTRKGPITLKVYREDGTD
ncbi:hypothetical protein Tco_0230090, partial [Tanacetum coccineum]